MNISEGFSLDSMLTNAPDTSLNSRDYIFHQSISGIGNYSVYAHVTINNECTFVDSMNIIVPSVPKTFYAQGIMTNVQSIESLSPMEVYGEPNATFYWYSNIDADPIFSEFSKDGISKFLCPYTEKGQHMFYVVQKKDDCESKTIQVATNIFECSATPPEPQNGIYCAGENPKTLIYAFVKPNELATWFSSYEDYQKNNILETGILLDLSDSLTPGIDSFYVATWLESEQCYSSPTVVTLQLLAPPEAQIIIKDSFCLYNNPIQIETAPILNPETDSIWGTDNCVSEGIFNPGTKQKSSQYTIYCERTIQYEIDDNTYKCSNTSEKNINVYDIAPPSVPEDTVFYALVNDQRTVELPFLFIENILPGACVSWYDETIMKLTGKSCDSIFQPYDTYEHSYTYYATQTLHGCESDPVAVDFTIASCPVGYVEISEYEDTLCVGTALSEISAKIGSYFSPNFTANGNENIIWATNRDGSEIYVGNTFIPSEIASEQGIIDYYVRAYDPDIECYGPYKHISYTIFDVETPSIDSEDTICVNELNTVSVSANADVHWIVDGFEMNDIVSSIPIDVQNKETITIQAFKDSLAGMCYSDTLSKKIVLKKTPRFTYEIIKNTLDHIDSSIICLNESNTKIRLINKNTDENITYRLFEGSNYVEGTGISNEYTIVNNILGSDTIIFEAQNQYCADTVKVPISVVPSPIFNVSISDITEDSLVEFAVSSDIDPSVDTSSIFVYVFDFDNTISETYYVNTDSIYDNKIEFSVTHKYFNGNADFSLVSTNGYQCSFAVTEALNFHQTEIYKINRQLPFDVYSVTGEKIIENITFRQFPSILKSGIYVLIQNDNAGSAKELIHIR